MKNKSIKRLVLQICAVVFAVWIFCAECAVKTAYAQYGSSLTITAAKIAEEQETAGNTQNTGPAITSPSAILMEASTGQVIYEKNPDELLHPASITKIMTLILIFDAIESGKLRLTDEVTVSEYAASMGGSQVFLEPGETQTVDTMIKCISIASANDACVW